MGEKYGGENRKRRTKLKSKQGGSGAKQGQCGDKIVELWSTEQKRSCMELHTASWPVRESNPGLRRERASSWPLDQQAVKSRRQDSNLRPLRPERSALPNWATPRCSWAFVLCCLPATRIYYHDSGKNASIFLKKKQIFKTNFPECGEKPGKALFYAGKWHFRLSGGSIS